MGIPPYMTPEENRRAAERIAHYKAFVASRGYVSCYEPDPSRPDRYLPRTRPFRAPSGKEYATAEEHFAAEGCMPGVEKDGVCYGYYEVGPLEGYIDPWDDETAFLESRGYFPPDDWLENNRKAEAFYEAHGFLPRWEKDGERFGHGQALVRENYTYPSGLTAPGPVWKRRSRT